LKNRPLVEMADIVRCAGQAFIEHSRKWINWQHRKVLLAIERCRTAALGGHRDRCTGCGHTATISYNSCRNRHCPRCQGNARRRWLLARERELLPTRYVHAVFTLPRELAPLALQKQTADLQPAVSTPALRPCLKSLVIQGISVPRLVLQRTPQLESALAVSSAYPLRHCSRRPRTGSLKLDLGPRSFFLPIGVLSRRYSAASSSRTSQRIPSWRTPVSRAGLLPLVEPRAFAAWLRVLFRHNWVVYSKPPFGGPEHVLRYLGAYTHRVAISSSRLIALSDATSPSAGAIPRMATRRDS